MDLNTLAQMLGKLHGMFKRLADKMEADVKALGGGLQQLATGHNALVDKVAELEQRLAANDRVVGSVPGSVSDASPIKKARAAELPTLQRAPEVEEAEWHTGEDDA